MFLLRHCNGPSFSVRNRLLSIEKSDVQHRGNACFGETLKFSVCTWYSGPEFAFGVCRPGCSSGVRCAVRWGEDCSPAVQGFCSSGGEFTSCQVQYHGVYFCSVLRERWQQLLRQVQFRLTARASRGRARVAMRCPGAGRVVKRRGWMSLAIARLLRSV